MEYSEILEDYEAYKARAISLDNGGKSLFPYADYGAALFGAYVLTNPREPGFELKTPQERLDVVNGLKAVSPVIVWRKFSAPLSSTKVFMSSLEVLVAEVSGKEGLYHYRESDGSLSTVDYSQAGSGSSRVMSLPESALVGLDRASTTAAAMRWTGLEWWFVLGIAPRPEVPDRVASMLRGLL